MKHQGEKWCVVKDTDGTVVHCHESRDKAMRQMRALYANEKQMASVEVSNFRHLVLVKAETIRERAFGLSGMDLKNFDADGMLFIYPTETRAAFHMQEMRFPIRVAFFDAAGGLVDQREMVPEGDVHRPLKAFKYVIELPKLDPLPDNARLILPI